MGDRDHKRSDRGAERCGSTGGMSKSADRLSIFLVPPLRARAIVFTYAYSPLNRPICNAIFTTCSIHFSNPMTFHKFKNRMVTLQTK